MRRLAGGTGRQVLSIGVVMAALSSGLIMAGLGRVSPPLDSRNLTDSTVWVPTASLGLVHPIDATIGRAGPALALDGSQGAELTTVQAGSDGYVIDQTERTVRFIDASARQFGVAWREPEPPDTDGGRLSVFAGSGVTWAYSSASHLLHRLNPGPQLQEVAQPIPLVVDGGDAVLRNDTDLVAPDEAEGEVVQVAADGRIRSATVARPGHDLVVRMVDDTVVAVDRDDRMLISLGPDLQPVNRCELEVTDAPMPAEGDGADGRLALVVPADRVVVVADVTTCQVFAVPIAGVLGVPVVAGSRVFVPEYGKGRVHILDIGGALSRIPVIESEPLGVTGSFDLVADDGMVVFNDPASNAAGAVFADGTVMHPGKFDLGESGLSVPEDPASPDTSQPDPTPGPDRPTGGDPTPDPDPDPDRTPTPDPDPEPDPDPVSAGTRTPVDPTPDPQDPDLPTLQCTADRPSVPVGQDVTFTTQVIGGQPGQVASFEFVVGSEAVADPDGSLVRSFPASGQVTVTVRGILSGGGTTAAAGCGTIAVGDAPLPDTLVCRSDTGQAAQVNQAVTFSASPIAGSTWEWTFSDGATSREANPQHRFSQPGPASATIVATSAGAGRQEATCPLQITEGIPPLTPSFDHEPKPAVATQPIRFVSTTPNPAAVASYSWTFTGGRPATGTGPEVTGVTWADPGAKSVELVVTNTVGQSYRVTSTVNVQSPPVVYEPPAVSVKAIADTITTSTIPLEFVTDAGLPTSATWTVSMVNDSGVPSTEATLTGLSASYTIPAHQGGRYTVKVVASDSRGATATDSVSFNAVRPLNPDFATDKTTVVVNEAVRFTGSSTNPAVTGWSWDFGDGGTGQGQSVTHTYTSAGDKRVTLTVSLQGASAPVTRSITVTGVGTTVAVPNVIGQSLAAAGSTLTGAELTVGSTSRACRPGVPLDEVFAQDPPAGGPLVLKQSVVDLWASDGTSWVMPDIAVGQTPADLGLSGKLTITPTMQPTSDPALDGQKVSQSVAANTPQCGQVTVDLLVWDYGEVVPPKLTCDAAVTYGAAGSCTATDNPNGGTVDWGDGSGPQPIGAGATLSHTYRRVGLVTPRLTHNGTTVSASGVSIEPDITVSCQLTGPPQDVYELDSSGRYVHPVDDSGNPILDQRVVLRTAEKAAPCTVQSRALTDLGGSVSWTVSSGRFSINGTGDFNGEIVGDWLGLQPGTISMTVTVNTVSQMASANIYVSGCG